MARLILQEGVSIVVETTRLRLIQEISFLMNNINNIALKRKSLNHPSQLHPYHETQVVVKGGDDRSGIDHNKGHLFQKNSQGIYYILIFDVK